MEFCKYKIYHSFSHQQDALHVDVCSLHGVAHVELLPVLRLEHDFFHRKVLHASVSLDHLVYLCQTGAHIALDGVSVVGPDSHLGHVLDVIELNDYVLHSAVLDYLLSPDGLVHFVLPKHLLGLLHLLFLLLRDVELRLVLLYPAALYLLVRLRPLVRREAIEKLYRELSGLYELLIFLCLWIIVAKEVSVQQNAVRVHIYFDFKRAVAVLRSESGRCRASLAGASVVDHLLARRVLWLEMFKIRLFS